MHTVGPVLMGDWFDHPNITALVLPHLPGQESGNSLARVLYGDVNPAGKMPYSMLADDDAVHYPRIVGSPASDPQVDFTEGLYIDYRAWDKMGLKPLIPFGHGISYTNYNYANLAIQKSADNCYAPSMVESRSEKMPGGAASLFQYLVEVTADVKNVGAMKGDEVAQLYVGYPEEAEAPVRQLRGFDKVKDLEPNASKTATFKLSKRDFSVWDVVRQEFRVVDGTYKIWVGKSSRVADLTLKGSVTMKNSMVVGMSSSSS
jgi:beta-glucosidase